VYLGDQYGATVRNNLMLGGDSYVMRLMADTSRVWYSEVTGNWLVRGDWPYGLAVVACSRVGVWRGNRVARIADDGTVVDVGPLGTCRETAPLLIGGHPLP
jgi:hypothetical protein